MAKATFRGKVRDRNGYAVHLFYEYRGHEYMVTDEHNGYSESMCAKHRKEQERIDREIAEEEYRESHTADQSKQFDENEIWALLGWD